jgi:hypothetical protein
MIYVFIRHCEIIDVESVQKHSISIETPISIEKFMEVAKKHKSKVLFVQNGEEGKYYCVIDKNILLIANSKKLH